ncbi:MAG: hypothetical protein AAF911_12980 [Planctomycetota bacterium]
MAYGIFGLFMLIPLALLLISIGGLIVTWVLVFRGGRVTADDLACCGHCGYPARGAANFNCAECGSDLREVGIDNRSQRKRPLGPLGFGVLWTLCLPIPALTAAVLLIAVGPKHQYANEMVTLTPNSGQYTSIDLDDMGISSAMGHWFGAGYATHGNLSLSIAGQNNQWDWLEVDSAAMTYDAMYSSFTPIAPAAPPATPGSPGTSATTSPNATHTFSATNIVAFDQAAALGWLKYAGADETHLDVIAEADELIQIVQQQPTQGLMNLSPTHFQVTSQTSFPIEIPRGWWVVLCLLAVPAVWVAGGVFYFLIYRKRTRLPGNPPRDPRDRLGPPRFAPPTT